MRLWLKNKRSVTIALLFIVLLFGGLMTLYWSDDFRLSFGNNPLGSSAGVLVLDNCDDDFRTPPFEDAVIMFGPNGKPSHIVTNLNTAQTVGGCRSLSLSADGQSFVVCENVANKLSAYQLRTGKQLWSLDGDFTSAIVSPDGIIYALRGSGTIYGQDLLAIDQSGRIIRQASVGGFDLALDANLKVLWLAGKNIKKCDLEFKVLQETEPFPWCAVSLDLNRDDGSIWVAEREHQDVAKSRNRLLKISSEGRIMRTVDLKWTPLCLRVDRSDGTVWVTGLGVQKTVAGRLLESLEKRTGRLPIGKKFHDFLTRKNVWSRTEKYDQRGALLCVMNEGGHTLDIDPTDGTLWLAGQKKIYHYSRQGKKMGVLGGVSDDQKYIAVLPPQHHGN